MRPKIKTAVKTVQLLPKQLRRRVSAGIETSQAAGGASLGIRQLLRTRVLREHKLGYRFAADQVFLNDALKHLRGAGVIPNPLRIHNGYGTATAHAQAAGLAAVHPAAAAEPERIEPGFEVLPGSHAKLGPAAFGLGRIGANKNMPLYGMEMKLLGPGKHADLNKIGGAIGVHKIGSVVWEGLLD